LESQQKRIDKLIADEADEADVRKQKEVLEETVQMIPDVKRRLAAAVQELSTMVVRKAFLLEDVQGPMKTCMNSKGSS
jgi:tubulin-specific chaperone A